ncbi:DUF6462 family protein [Butyrivibrio sp.]|uniref:DUF6462 family protein n=1 Tax=Butyrivibrio sp. TaxID=28121 RepID=UPI0025BF541F|nr:DUF6462 family protein [Butyrivibrio sp.]MBE5837937.1 hypothetical protein [Butyrivibrio sp.]
MATPRRHHNYDAAEYLQLQGAMEIYDLGYEQIKDLAKEAGALRKMKKSVLINKMVLNRYIEAHTAY